MTDNKTTTATETATGADNGTNEAGNKTFTQQDMDNLAPNKSYFSNGFIKPIKRL